MYKIHVINLERRQDKLHEFKNQIQTLSFNRFDAVDGFKLHELYKTDNNLKELMKCIHDDSFKNPFEIACAFSHWNIWNIINNDEESKFGVVLEDDVQLPSNFSASLNTVFLQLETLHEVPDIIYIGGRDRNNWEPKSKNGWSQKSENIYVRNGVLSSSYETDRTTSAYIISKIGTQKLINDNSTVLNHPIDHWIISNPKIIIADFFPHFTYSHVNHKTDIQRKPNIKASQIKFGQNTFNNKGFVINLDIRPDRYEKIQLEFKQFFPSLQYERVSAINGHTIHFDSSLSQKINEWNFKYLSKYTLEGVVGCCLSHLKVWKKIIDIAHDDDHTLYWVWEDDACIFLNILDNIACTPIPLNMQFVWFSYVPIIKNNSFMEWKSHPHPITTECYALTKECAKNLYSFIENNIGAIDSHMWGYFKSIDFKNAYIYCPSIVKQRDIKDSDIR